MMDQQGVQLNLHLNKLEYNLKGAGGNHFKAPGDPLHGLDITSTTHQQLNNRDFRG
jgi:hypothetical protein